MKSGLPPTMELDMPARILPADDEVVKEYEAGSSILEIAARYNVAHSAVSRALSNKGRSPGMERSGYMPPGLQREHWHAPAAKRLRSLARREQGKRALTPDDTRLLDAWLHMLRDRDWVVHYDPGFVSPEDGSNAASPTKGGWWYGPRPDGTPADRITAYEPVH